jgi:hypothetical protein
MKYVGKYLSTEKKCQLNVLTFIEKKISPPYIRQFKYQTSY